MVSLLSHTSFEKVFTTLYIIESPKLLDLSDSLDSNRITHAPNLLLLPSCLLMHPIKCKGSLSPKRLPEPAVSARRALLRKILDFKMYFSSISLTSMDGRTGLMCLHPPEVRRTQPQCHPHASGKNG